MAELVLAPRPLHDQHLPSTGAHNQPALPLRRAVPFLFCSPLSSNVGFCPPFCTINVTLVPKNCILAKTATDKDTRHPHAWQLARAVFRASPRPAPSKGLGLSESARARRRLHCVALHDLSCVESCERGREHFHFAHESFSHMRGGGVVARGACRWPGQRRTSAHGSPSVP
jgi:hypothetical protein